MVGRLTRADHDAASGRLTPTLGSSQRDGLAGDDGRFGAADVHGIGVHHPGHDLFVRVDVRCGNVLVGSDRVDDFGDVPAGERLELALRHPRRIADDAALAAPKRDVGDSALPRHPRRERRHFVETDVRVVPDASLRGTQRDVVLHAVAGEDFDFAVVHLHGTRHGDLTFGPRQDAPDTRLEIEDACGSIELLEHRTKDGPVSGHGSSYGAAWRVGEAANVSPYFCVRCEVKGRQAVKSPLSNGLVRAARASRYNGAMRGSSIDDPAFTTVSGRKVDVFYTPDDLAGTEYVRDIADPGEFPYTRGIHPLGYRGKLWTMRQFAGFGTPEDTNAAVPRAARRRRHGPERRVRSAHADGPRSRPRAVARRSGEVRRQRRVARRHGGALRRHPARRRHDVDDDQLAGGDDLRDVSRRGRAAGRDWQTLSGTIQNDILKEFIAQKEYIYPPRPSMRLVTDVFAFCADHVPRWNTISVSGYHIREAGATAAQELAFTLRDGIEYVQWGIDAGLDVDRLRAAHLVLLQRAQRLLRGDGEVPRGPEDLGPRDARPVQAPRRALVEAPLPHADGRRLVDRAAALQQRGAHRDSGARGGDRRHQLAAHQLTRRSAGASDRGSGDTGAPHAADHRARERRGERRRSARRLRISSSGSRAISSGRRIEYFDTIDRMGGMVAAIERGYPQREIADSAYRFQQAVERGDKTIVGVNEYVDQRRAARSRPCISTSRAPRRQLARSSQSLRRERQRRARCARRARMRSEHEAAATHGRPTKLMPHILDAVRAYATIGEMCDALRDVWGECEEDTRASEWADRKHPRRHCQAGARRPRPWRKGHRARAA